MEARKRGYNWLIRCQASLLFSCFSCWIINKSKEREFALHLHLQKRWMTGSNYTITCASLISVWSGINCVSPRTITWIFSGTSWTVYFTCSCNISISHGSSDLEAIAFNRAEDTEGARRQETVRYGWLGRLRSDDLKGQLMTTRVGETVLLRTMPTARLVVSR